MGAELRQLALFLGIRGEKLEDNIKCILKHSQGKFKRKGKKNLLVFNDEQKKKLQYVGKDIADLLEKMANYRTYIQLADTVAILKKSMLVKRNDLSLYLGAIVRTKQLTVCDYSWKIPMEIKRDKK